jgi:lytic cellulose monooxygenase (C1-hydroxylating)
MRSGTQYLAALAASLPSVLGHGYLTGASVAGVWYPGFVIQMYYEHPHPPVVGWDTAALDSGFVSPDAFQGPDIICHKNATPAALHVPVQAGQQVTVYWVSSWPEGHQGTGTGRVVSQV